MVQRLRKVVSENEVEIIPPDRDYPQVANRNKFKKGMKPSKNAGRKPGTPNKIPANIKKIIESSLVKLGGDLYLMRLAKTRPELYVSLIRAIIPMQMRTMASDPVPQVPDGPTSLTREEAAAQLRARGIPVPSFLDDPKLLEKAKRDGR